MMREPHPFAGFVRILGRGKSLIRSLTEPEAEQAMAMILSGEVEPEQLGAFLMLLRVKEESAEEIAGFVRAARATLRVPENAPRIDLDWSAYAGKRRQLPWYLLAALLLARNGWRVFMHGGEGHTGGRIYTSEALGALGLTAASDFADAARRLARGNFAYLPIEAMSPKLADMLGLRPLLGLRSPVHSFARLLNPFGAPAVLQGVFHPGYMSLHRDAALLLGERSVAVFRGEGGEIERRPGKPCELVGCRDGAAFEEIWAPMLADPRLVADEDMDLQRLQAVWQGRDDDAYAESAIVGTVAIALRTLGAARDPADAESKALTLWRDRDRAALMAA